MGGLTGEAGETGRKPWLPEVRIPPGPVTGLAMLIVGVTAVGGKGINLPHG